MDIQGSVHRALFAHNLILEYRKKLIQDIKDNDKMSHSINLNEMRDCADDIIIVLLKVINDLTGTLYVDLSAEQEYLKRYVYIETPKKGN